MYKIDTSLYIVMCIFLEKEMATRPSILAWRTPWTEEPGGFMGSQSQTRLTTERQCVYVSPNLPIYPSIPFPYAWCVISACWLEALEDSQGISYTLFPILFLLVGRMWERIN